jgi:hypothetical protein
MDPNSKDKYEAFRQWTQPYVEWYEKKEEIDELAVEYSDLAEANEVINRIRAMK